MCSISFLGHESQCCRRELGVHECTTHVSEVSLDSTQAARLCTEKHAGPGGLRDPNPVSPWEPRFRVRCFSVCDDRRTELSQIGDSVVP